MSMITPEMNKYRKMRGRKMSRCVIITAYNAYKIRESIELRKDDFIICADGGYKLAREENIVPKVIIGDFDSFEGEVHLSDRHLLDMICLPVEKDDTDTLFCLKYGIEKGFEEFVIVGGLGGRADHTFANIQTLAYGCCNCKNVSMCDKMNMFTIISGKTIKIPKKENSTLSVFSYSDKCTGVSLSDVKYPLKNSEITSIFPIGVSNEFIGNEAEVTCEEGMLLITVVQSFK